MGQRHQIYVVSKCDQYIALGAFHHQWCYGIEATANAIRLTQALIIGKTAADGKWSNYSLNDQREIDVVVKAIYGLSPSGQVSMVHNKNEYLIDDNGIAHPELGDNNDGACLIIIDETSKEVRTCLFTPGHVDGEFGDECKAWKPYTPKEYLNFYYRGDDLAKALSGNKEFAKFIKMPVTPVTLSEFKKVFSKSIKSKRGAA